MAEINLPDMSLLWASAGDVLPPSDSKIQQGWTPEVPPRQWFNWLDNRQDEAIAHIAQHGITVWSASLEYQANKSYVQGSDGLVYKAITTNTNINPVGNVGDWAYAFITADTATKVASAAQARAMSDNGVFLSPLQLANAFTGTNRSAIANGWQKLPGGIILQWGGVQIATANTQTPFSFNIEFPSQCFKLIISTDTDANIAYNSQGYIINKSTGSAAVSAPNTGISWFAIGI